MKILTGRIKSTADGASCKSLKDSEQLDWVKCLLGNVVQREKLENGGRISFKK